MKGGHHCARELLMRVAAAWGLTLFLQSMPAGGNEEIFQLGELLLALLAVPSSVPGALPELCSARCSCSGVSSRLSAAHPQRCRIPKQYRAMHPAGPPAP